MIRIGTVSDINADKRLVRVHFPAANIVSGWLKVVKQSPYIPKTENASGGSGEASFALHSHDIKVAPWMPAVNDTVLCLYDADFNGDGFVLGAL